MSGKSPASPPGPPATPPSAPRDPAALPSVELIVNRTSTETRVALLEGGRLTEVFIERDESRSLVGNIYKGTVSKILPGMQSAFVSIGLVRDAFLHVDDLVGTNGNLTVPFGLVSSTIPPPIVSIGE